MDIIHGDNLVSIDVTKHDEMFAARSELHQISVLTSDIEASIRRLLELVQQKQLHSTAV